MLAGDRAAELDAEGEDLGGQLLGALDGAVLAAVEEDQRMQVAVAGVEDVGDPDAALGAEAVDFAQRLAEAGAGTTPSWTM